MTVVTEHHSEEEGERNDGKGGWVSLLVIRDTVGVNDQLEGSNDIVHLEEGGGHD